MIRKITLSKDNMFWLYGALIALTISLFTFFVVRSYAEKTDAKHQNEMALMNKELEKRAIIADNQAKELHKQNLLNHKLSARLEAKFNTQTVLLLDISKNYKQNLIEINKLKNEKVYIPLDVPLDEQHKFLSDYVYKPY